MTDTHVIISLNSMLFKQIKQQADKKSMSIEDEIVYILTSEQKRRKSIAKSFATSTNLGRPSSLTKDVLIKMQKLRNKKVPLREIALQCNTSHSTVSRNTT